MKKAINYLHSSFEKANYIDKLLYLFSFTYLPVIIYAPIAMIIDEIAPDKTVHDKLTNDFFIVVILGPILETLVFQLGLFYFLLKLFKQNSLAIACILASVIFGLAHPYSLTYFIFAFLIGITFNISFFLLLPNKKVAFWSVVLIHALHNLIAISFSSA